MGFLDKAKKMAEQAQTKLDEVQKQFNEGQGSKSGGGPAVEYDKHGRPLSAAGSAPPPSAAPPVSAAPAAPPASAAPAESPLATPGLPQTESAAPPPPVAPVAPAPPAPGVPDTAGPPPEDPNRPSYAPPTMTSGDPLAG
jgi:hypothetical protein